jgi:hypothetical protein
MTTQPRVCDCSGPNVCHRKNPAYAGPCQLEQREAKNGTHKPEMIERPRARRNAAKVLALTLQGRLRTLYDAQAENDEDKIVMATANLAQVMYENVEFAIWALKTVAGMNPPPPEVLKPISQTFAPPPANDPRFTKPPHICVDCDGAHDPDIRCPNHHAGMAPSLPQECTCPPLEAGIIGRERHMTSCPKFVP